MNVQMDDLSNKYSEKLAKKQQEIAFLKDSYKEQRSRVEIEHEMLSNSLYEMSMQFVALRNQIYGK